jgi:hypothetical protein
MEEYKIINFSKDFSDEKIAYESLSIDEINSLFTTVFNLETISNEINVFNLFLHDHTNVLHFEKSDSTEGFKDFLKHFNINLYNEEVLLIWNNTKVDKFKISFLIEYWDYIWYGSSDEVVILFFPFLNKSFLITDIGNVYW